VPVAPVGEGLGLGEAVGVAVGDGSATVGDGVGDALGGADVGVAVGITTGVHPAATAIAAAVKAMRSESDRPDNARQSDRIPAMCRDSLHAERDSVRRPYDEMKFGRMTLKWPIGCVWRWFFTSTSQRGTSHMCSLT
jgi:hypothetical protein